jgi:hypothetical protein
MSITKNSTRRKIVVTWKPPVHSNGWLLSYTVRLYDEMKQEIHTLAVECTQSPVVCHVQNHSKSVLKTLYLFQQHFLFNILIFFIPIYISILVCLL